MGGEGGGTGPVRTGPSQKLRNHTAISEVKGQGLVEQSEPGPSSLQYRNETMELVPVWMDSSHCLTWPRASTVAQLLTLALVFVIGAFRLLTPGCQSPCL